MEVSIKNCNNIADSNITLAENKLNIKYAINGTGKSTIARAIAYSASHNETGLKDLTPYSNIGSNDVGQLPSVTGLPEGINVEIFDESYVNQYVFMEDELVKNSFDIFIKTESYESQLVEINELVSNIRAMFDSNPELETLISDMNEFISCFGNSRTGIANNGALVKGMSKGNLIENIPEGLEDYTEFLTDSKNSAWLKWQSNGRSYMELSTKCPFCSGEIAPYRERIDRIKNEYDAKTVEHLSKILSVVEKLGHYFSTDTNEHIREITKSVNGLSEEQKSYLVGIRNNVETMQKKLLSLRNIGFNSLKDVDRLSDTIENYKINIEYLPHLSSEYTIDKTNIINTAIDNLRTVVGSLQGAVNRQKIEIARTVEKYNTEINEFLENAGYSYKVSLEENAEHSYKLKLKFGTENIVVDGVKSHLSYGERNAFALVLFMYHSLHKQSNFIVLDDPISSFDKNKKFAIIDTLFIKGNSFRGKTVLLLTHDLEPIIDSIYNHASFFDAVPSASFLENNSGVISEIEITKDDILSSVKVANDNICNAQNSFVKLIYLRRLIEIVDGKTNTWHLLSNLFHKREIPTITNEQMSIDAIQEATIRIREYIEDFEYEEFYQQSINNALMVSFYRSAESNYEKLQFYRIIFNPVDEHHVLRKFLNETYHIENDLLFQLNPLKYNTIPNYIIRACDEKINSLSI